MNFLIFIIICVAKVSCAIPDVQFEALKTGGFRATLADNGNINSFKITANINDELDAKNIGSITNEVTVKSGDFFILLFPDHLKVGDTIHYRVFVTVGRLGYTKSAQSWPVTNLLDEYTPLNRKCTTSTSVFNGGRSTCVGNIIFEDNFNGDTIDLNNWIIEHRIPTNSEPNFEFNSYENKPETRYLKDNVLYLKPIALQDDDSVRGTLDLREGCTSRLSQECLYSRVAAYLLPPVKAAKIQSKTSFKYGKIEIRAKLPSGDWIFPIIQLQPKYESTQGGRIWIAYSRGNDHLTGNAGDDLGSRLLFAGPVTEFSEPGRSKHLVSRRSEVPYNSDFHIYSLEWTPDRLKFFIDFEEYGNIVTESDIDVRNLGMNNEYVVSLGVAVGGLNDFPEGYNSNGYPKPWIDSERFVLKKFFEARNQWLNTWRGANASLQIDYVKIEAV